MSNVPLVLCVDFLKLWENDLLVANFIKSLKVPQKVWMEQTDKSKIHYEGTNSDQLCEEMTETIDYMFKSKVLEFHFAPFPIDTLVAALVIRI